MNTSVKWEILEIKNKKIDPALGIRKQVSSNSTGLTFFIYLEVYRFDDK